MSSREIAEITGKDIGHIHRDIRVMLHDLIEDDPNLDHVREDKDGRGYTSCFHLPKDLTITLVAGYSVKLRHRIVKRWEELENAQPQPQAVALTPLDMLLDLVGSSD